MQHQGMAVKIVLVVTPLILSLTLWFCGSNAATETSAMDIRGIVTNIDLANESGQRTGTLGFLRVEGKREPDTEYDKAIIRITTDCKIQRLNGNARQTVNFKAIRKDSKVEARFIGGVAASDPPQATAQAIIILDD